MKCPQITCFTISTGELEIIIKKVVVGRWCRQAQQLVVSRQPTFGPGGQGLVGSSQGGGVKIPGSGEEPGVDEKDEGGV